MRMRITNNARTGAGATGFVARTAIVHWPLKASVATDDKQGSLYLRWADGNMDTAVGWWSHNRVRNPKDHGVGWPLEDNNKNNGMANFFISTICFKRSCCRDMHTKKETSKVTNYDPKRKIKQREYHIDTCIKGLLLHLEISFLWSQLLC